MSIFKGIQEDGVVKGTGYESDGQLVLGLYSPGKEKEHCQGCPHHPCPANLCQKLTPMVQNSAATPCVSSRTAKAAMRLPQKIVGNTPRRGKPRRTAIMLPVQTPVPGMGTPTNSKRPHMPYRFTCLPLARVRAVRRSTSFL